MRTRRDGLKSFSRVATFAKATAAEEHVERVDIWKKVERFMAGWSATEMPRKGVRPYGLAPGAEKTTVVIYCGNHFGLFLPILSVAVLEMGGRFAIWLARYSLIFIIGIPIPI